VIGHSVGSSHRNMPPASGTPAGDDDVFAWDNPIWSRAGVVTPTGTDSGSLGTRNSFPARRAATRVLQEIMGLRGDPID